jgi:hypothetical protein
MMFVLTHQRALDPLFNRCPILPNGADVDEEAGFRVDPTRIDDVQSILRPACSVG